MQRLRIAMVVLAAIFVPVRTGHTGQTTAPPGGVGIRLAGVSTDASIDPLARLYIINRLAPGTAIRREVEVSNGTRSTADVAVYTAGARLGNDGFEFDAGHTQNQLSSWTSVSEAVLRLLPGTDALETVTLNVPNDASFGEDYAVIWSQVSAPSRAAGGVILINRVGIRMYISIGRGGTSPPNFKIGTLTADRFPSGQPVVATSVENDSPRPLQIGGSLTLSSGPGGIRLGPFPVILGASLGPGDSEPATVVFHEGFPIGPWQASVRFSSGPTSKSTTARLTFPALAAAVPARSGLAIFVVPILVVAVLLVMLTSTAVARRRLRRRIRSRKRGRHLRANRWPSTLHRSFRS